MSEKPKADEKPSETTEKPKAKARTAVGPERALTRAQLRRADIGDLQVQATEAAKGLDAVKGMDEDDPRRLRAERAASRTNERLEEARKLQGEKR